MSANGQVVISNVHEDGSKRVPNGKTSRSYEFKWDPKRNSYVKWMSEMQIMEARWIVNAKGRPLSDVTYVSDVKISTGNKSISVNPTQALAGHPTASLNETKPAPAVVVSTRLTDDQVKMLRHNLTELTTVHDSITVKLEALRSGLSTLLRSESSKKYDDRTLDQIGKLSDKIASLEAQEKIVSPQISLIKVRLAPYQPRTVGSL